MEGCELTVVLSVSGHSRLNSGVQPFSFNSPKQHLCQTQTDAGGWWHNPNPESNYNFNARNHCLKESPAILTHRLFSLAMVPQFQLSTTFLLATPLSLDHLFHLWFQTPDRKFQILLPLMIREIILFIATHWSSPHIWLLMPSRSTQTNQGIDTPSTCCPLFIIYYKSWNKAALKVKVLVTQSCLTLCDLMDCSPPTRLLCLWDSLGKNTGVGCHSLLWGIVLTQGSNSGLLHCRQILTNWATRKPLKVFKTFMFEGVHYKLKANDKKWSDFSKCQLLMLLYLFLSQVTGATVSKDWQSCLW